MFNLDKRTDNLLDPFFKKHGKQWLWLMNVIIVVGVPLTQLVTVVFGTQRLTNGGFQINTFFLIPAFLLVFMGLFGRYTKRYERQVQRATFKSMLLSLALCLVIVILSLPHFPLARYWDITPAWTSIVFQAPLIIGLIAGLIAIPLGNRINRKSTFKS